MALFHKNLNKTEVDQITLKYNIALKNKKVYSLPFEAANYTFNHNQAKSLQMIDSVCKEMGKCLLLYQQVQIAEKLVIGLVKYEGIWLPAMLSVPSNNNTLRILVDMFHPKTLYNEFLSMLTKTISESNENVYEIVPGLAFFGDNGNLKVTASVDFIRTLNNE